MGKQNIFRRVGKWFKKIFSKTKTIAEKYIPVGIEVVEEIKKLVDSPLTPLLTMLIPGTLDDAIAAKVKQVLPGVLASLKISNGCANKSTPDEVIQCAIAYLRTLKPGDERHDHWLRIAAKITAAVSDGVLTTAELIDITQEVYDNEYKK